MDEGLKATFGNIFGAGGEIRTYFAPGRVNLIGGHTDYNGGHVLPCALTIGTYGLVRKRSDDKLRLYSVNFRHLGIIECSIENLYYEKDHDWANYIKGVVWAFAKRGMVLDTGFDLLISGDMPIGAGLSSSASLEVLTGVALVNLYGFEVTMKDIAFIGQYAENRFIGVHCGIMDPFVISMARADCALFLDTADLTYEYVPIILDKYRIVIANTMKQRELGNSLYNERRRQCEQALSDLQKVCPIGSLGELTGEAFEQVSEAIVDFECRRRARHAVYENQRTVRARKALRRNDFLSLGKFMNASHISLRDDYEVTGVELDTLVEAAWKQPGVLGSRMTGGGFGGCTVSIVEQDMEQHFIEKVGKIYKKRTGYSANFYVIEAGKSAGIL